MAVELTGFTVVIIVTMFSVTVPPSPCPESPLSLPHLGNLRAVGVSKGLFSVTIISSLALFLYISRVSICLSSSLNMTPSGIVHVEKLRYFISC